MIPVTPDELIRHRRAVKEELLWRTEASLGSVIYHCALCKNSSVLTHLHSSTDEAVVQCAPENLRKKNISSWILLTSELHLGKREVCWPKKCHMKEVWSEARTWATCGNKSSHPALDKCLSAACCLTCSLVQHGGMGTLFLSHVLYRSCEAEAAISSSTNLGIALAPSVPKVPFIVALCVCGERSVCIRCPKKAPEVVCSYP